MPSAGSTWTTWVLRLPALLLAGLAAFYKRFVSPMLPPACRFQPTCSEYMHDALLAHGVLRGGWMGVKRLARCHPGNPGGWDPVPGTGKGNGQ